MFFQYLEKYEVLFLIYIYCLDKYVDYLQISYDKKLTLIYLLKLLFITLVEKSVLSSTFKNVNSTFAVI